MPRRHGLSDAGVTAGTNLVLDSVAKQSLQALAAELQCTRSEVVRRLLTADPDALRALLVAAPQVDRPVEPDAVADGVGPMVEPGLDLLP